MMEFFRKNVRSIMLVVVVLFIVSCFAGYGLYSGGDNRESGGDYAVAQVDGQKVMFSRIETEMFQMIQSMGMTATVTSEDYPALRASILEQMAILSQLDKEVKSRKINVPKEEVDVTIKNIEASFPTREVFMQQMQMAGMDEKKLREVIQEQLLRQKVFDEVTAPASTDQTEMQGFYDTMKLYAFQKPEGFKMNLAHFKTEEAAEKARTVAGTDGVKWDEAMEAVSADLLDYVPYATPVLIADAQLIGDVEFVKGEPMNRVIKPIKMAEGDYMLSLKRSKEAAGTATYDEVSADIEQMILDQKRQGLQSQFLQEMRARATVEVLDPELFPRPEPEVAVTSEDIKLKDASGDVVEEIAVEEVEVVSGE